MNSPPPPFRRPSRAPDVGAPTDLRDWLALRDAGLTRTAAAAVTWRNGLAGFVTLLMSVLVLKGADLADLAQPNRFVAIGGLLGGATLAIVGLWRTLAAEAPAEGQASYDGVVSRYGSIAAYLQSVASDSQVKLRQARRCVAAALALLLVGVGAWWLAPQATSAGKARITWHDGGTNRTACGDLVASTPNTIALKANSATDPLLLPSSSVVSIDLVSSCGSGSKPK